MQHKRLENIKKITLLALMLALTIIFCFVPVQLFGTITLALMILPTIIVAQFADFKTSLAMGIMMGVVNYIAWFTTKAASPVAPIFQNPIVCIVPRIMIAVVCYFTTNGLKKLALRARLKKQFSCRYVRENQNENMQDNAYDNSSQPPQENGATKKQSKHANEILTNQLVYAASAALGVVTNTLFVAIFTLLFFNNTSIAQNTIVTVEYVLAWFGVNFAAEVVVFSLITPPVVLALKASKLVA